MKYFLDCEFIDTGSTIDLISIGIVCEDGRELYLQSVEFDPDKADYWIQKNVLDNLMQCPVTHDCGMEVDLRYHAATHGECGSGRTGVFTCHWRSLHHIRSEVLAFLDPIKYGKPELWGWCSGYDFVALCQLFGKMTNLPRGYPHYICDFQYVLDGRHISDDQLPQQEGSVHNALEDARHLKKLWECVVMNNDWKQRSV